MMTEVHWGETRMRNVMLRAVLLLGAVVAAAPAIAEQQTYLTPGCKATPAQMEEARKAVIAFDRATSLEERLAVIDPNYTQHNPRIAKGAREKGVSDYEYLKSIVADFLKARSGGAGAGGRGAAGANDGRGPAAGPQPPPPTLEVVTVECDLVTKMTKIYRQDPTAAPGTFYESFSFDLFRVRNGKIAEHWDHQLIAAPGGGRGD